MVNYQCPYCEYNSERLSNIRNHFNKKNKCDIRVSEIDPKSCKKKEKKKEKKKDINIDEVEELRKQLLEKDRQIEKLIEKVGNTTNNNTLNITINNYDKPNTEHLTDKDVLTALQSNVYVKIFELIYFNEAVPQNHSIIYPDMKNNKIMTYQDGEFKTMLIKDFKNDINNRVDLEVQQLMNSVEGSLENPLFEKDINKKKKKARIKSLKKYKKILNDREESDQIIEEDSKRMLNLAYDNKEMILKTKTNYE
jgi:hypothetical protein